MSHREAGLARIADVFDRSVMTIQKSSGATFTRGHRLLRAKTKRQTTRATAPDLFLGLKVRRGIVPAKGCKLAVFD